MSKKLKDLLKEAKAAILEKDYKLVIAKCTEILEKDGNNYSALLWMGAAYQDSNPTLSVKYLREATHCSSDPIIAYQGLLKCAPNDEIPEICKKLLKLVPAKYPELYKRLENAALVTKNANACVEILQKDSLSEDEERVKSAYQSLVEIYLQSTIDRRWFELFEKAFADVLTDQSVRSHCKKFNKYLRILAQLQKSDLLLVKCVEMLQLYPSETIPLESICRIYSEKCDDPDFDYESKLPEGIESYADRLLKTLTESPHAFLAKGLFFFRNENFINARDCLNKANSNGPMNVLCLKTLGATHFKLRAYSLAEYCFVASQCQNAEYVTSLVEQQTKEKCLKAVEVANALLKEAQGSESVKVLEALAKALIRLGEHDAATAEIEKLSGLNQTESVNILQAFKHQIANELEKSLAILEGTGFETCKYFLALGECHFAAKNYQEALSALLKATKLEPYNTDCFHGLGKIYSVNGDEVRARKCFERSVYLNPQHEQSVIHLSTIYRRAEEWELNLKLLQTAAQAIPNTSCKWAALQLGFHNLAQNQFDEAIAAFRSVLRTDPQNSSSWEGLADSYLKRGSFNSALKVYQKICELSEDNLYARLQVANIKRMLRLYKEAIVSYEELLADRPNYLPAVKGIADAHLGFAYQFFDQQLLGRCKYHAEQAVEHLISAIQIRNNLICLWRLLAKNFELIASLPSSKAELRIPGSLANEPADYVTLQGDKLYELASRFYCRAIKINSSDEMLWYELALNYYNHAVRYGRADTKKKFLLLADQTTRYTIKLAPGRWKNWNLLGVICTTDEINNPRLAQHCFVKALELEKKSAVVWTNLGAFYMRHGLRKLSNEAFSQAQQSETSYENAWTGQAQIAEVIDRLETIDLLKHSLSLGYTNESAVRYAHSVCSLLNDCPVPSEDKQQNKRVRYAIENMHAVATALDAITWYCNVFDEDVSVEALSFLGYLHNKQGHPVNAIKAFSKAVEKARDSSQRDKMLCNLGYCQLKNNNPLEAIKAFHDVTDATFSSTVGLAYAHFKAKEYENSYAVYQSALEWLATTDLEKALILVAMSSMVYAFQGESDAKNVLFQCIDLPEPPIEALLSACSMGLIHNDMQLSELVLRELVKYESNPEWSHHVAFLTSEFHLRQQKPRTALLYLLSQVHLYPDRPLLRKLLATFLLRNQSKNEKYLASANSLVQSTIVMQRRNNDGMLSLDVAKLLALASETMRCIDLKVTKKLAQKALHVNPTCKEAWAAFKQSS